MKLFLILSCLLLCLRSDAFAQQPLAVAPASPEFLSRYDFHLSAAALANSDPRYSWDTHFGGEIDIVDYVVGRAATIIDYQAVLGHELRPFDPVQGNYILELSSSYRLRGTEIAAFFHHVSRHLSDRPKIIPVAWNILGVRALRHATVRNLAIDFVGEVGGTTQRVNADYVWTANGDLIVRRQLTPRFGVFGRGVGHLMGVDQSNPARGTQAGGAIEGGLRIRGEAAVAEFFAGFERRFDAHPLDFTAQRWFMVGFRVLRDGG